ncbi:hypothetical protein OHAE_2766 [Ochrobactrum soli]|uniref:Uncharacterized protein n=1 Tax=Ochrobactrum soli TaxID=2448455 RepID=A0A2P9HFE6_9HYPH|nr:hypothetical protein OHAE_2766 [[Ochrobactrum] soli]
MWPCANRGAAQAPKAGDTIERPCCEAAQAAAIAPEELGAIFAGPPLRG